MEVCMNGSMSLLCVSGHKQKNATFIRLSDGLVIRALYVDWSKGDNDITWGQGKYYKHIGDILDDYFNGWRE